MCELNLTQSLSQTGRRNFLGTGFPGQAVWNPRVRAKTVTLQINLDSGHQSRTGQCASEQWPATVICQDDTMASPSLVATLCSESTEMAAPF